MIDWWIYQWTQYNPTWYSGVSLFVGICAVVAMIGTLVWTLSAYQIDKKRAARWFLFSLIAGPVAFVFWPIIAPFAVLYGLYKIIQLAW